MKHYALELFGFCLGFLGIVPSFHNAPEPSETERLSPEPCLHHGTITESFVQIGVVAIDYGPDRSGAHTPLASGRRCSRGPARIIASVG